ncbi:hypothetical protein BLOT_003420 [Blomia tropicalis]|nr:hypothetical protein BLOT_003420 [Blomia tropicalis]
MAPTNINKSKSYYVSFELSDGKSISTQTNYNNEDEDDDEVDYHLEPIQTAMVTFTNGIVIKPGSMLMPSQLLSVPCKIKWIDNVQQTPSYYTLAMLDITNSDQQSIHWLVVNADCTEYDGKQGDVIFDYIGAQLLEPNERPRARRIQSISSLKFPLVHSYKMIIYRQLAKQSIPKQLKEYQSRINVNDCDLKRFHIPPNSIPIAENHFRSIPSPYVNELSPVVFYPYFNFLIALCLLIGGILCSAMFDMMMNNEIYYDH